MKLTVEWKYNGRRKTHTIDTQGVVTIGRARECDVILEDPTVSRDHAIIRAKGRAFHIKNRSKRSVLRVNGRKIAPRASQMLRHGDLIEIGPRTVRIAAIRPDPHIAGHPVQCPNCRRTVDLKDKDCQHCGQNLAGAVTRVFNG